MSPFALGCREREDKWAPFKVQAKKDRKTLDFECILTDDSHRVNIAALMAQRDTPQWEGDTYISYEAKINLFMAMPGMQQATPAVACIRSAAGIVWFEEEGSCAFLCNSQDD